MRRIMIFHHQMGFYGGAEELIVKLSNYLIKNDNEVSVVTLSSPPENVECKADFITPCNEFGYKNWELSVSDGITLTKKILSLKKLYKDHVDDFDIVNIHNFPACWSAFPKKKPSVWMCNEPPNLWYDNDSNHGYVPKLIRNVFVDVSRTMIDRCVDEICVSDDFNSARAKRLYNKPTHVIPYGIDYDFYSNPEGKYDFTDDFTVLQVGVISQEKNQLESIKSVEKLINKIPNIKLILVGMRDNGSYDRSLTSYIEKKGLVNHIKLLGHQSKDVVRKLYHSCDVSIFPIKSKGGWLSVFEALCAEKPIIVSPEMTASSIILKERIGIVSDNMSESIMEVYNNPVSTIKGKQYVRDNLSWDKFGQGMLNVMENLQ